MVALCWHPDSVPMQLLAVSSNGSINIWAKVGGQRGLGGADVVEVMSRPARLPACVWLGVISCRPTLFLCLPWLSSCLVHRPPSMTCPAWSAVPCPACPPAPPCRPLLRTGAPLPPTLMNWMSTSEWEGEEQEGCLVLFVAAPLLHTLQPTSPGPPCRLSFFLWLLLQRV